MSDIAVDIINLTKLYGSFVALQNVSLDIRDTGPIYARQQAKVA